MPRLKIVVSPIRVRVSPSENYLLSMVFRCSCGLLRGPRKGELGRECLIECLTRWVERLDETGAERRLAVLVHDMRKVGRRGCRLPIDEQTAQIITAQKQRVRERYPDTPAAELRLLPRTAATPPGAGRWSPPSSPARCATGWPR